MKKILISFFILISFGNSFAFSDLEQVWRLEEKESINYLKEKNIIGGYEDGTFKPMNEISRAELMKILIGAFAKSQNLDIEQIKKDYDKDCFTDVKAGEWYTSYVCFGKEKNIISGDKGYFRPADSVIGAEVFKMVLNTYQIDSSKYDESLLLSDEPNKKDYYKGKWFSGFLAKAIEKNILINTFYYYPENKITRSNVSNILFRLNKAIENNSEKFEYRFSDSYEKYESKFGVSFYHDKGVKFEDINEYCFDYDKEKKDCIKGNLIQTKYDTFSSLSIQIFEKDKNISIKDSISKQILNDTNREKCEVFLGEKDGNFEKKFQIKAKDGYFNIENGPTAHQEVCGNYALTNGIQFFTGNDNNDKFLFLWIGQDYPPYKIESIEFTK